ncbi:MAG: hypothetical protein JXP34_03025, partial [Planctomycetes bacterium]|nr:hypothetical protein [Planctomycetota bacterium]
MTGAARILRALIAKDLAVLAGRRMLWFVRTAFVGALFAAIAVVWLSVGESPSALAQLGPAVATALFLAGYLGSILAASAIAAGTIDEECSRGMLEILAASPLSNRQILASFLVSRLLAAAYLVLAALPLFAVPLFLGGVGP